jgi:uncharacterized membrane protein
MARRTMYFPRSLFFFAILVLILVLVAGLIFIGVIGLAFRDVGFTPITIVLILVGTFLGSFVNIPITKLKTSTPIVKEEFVNFFGVAYRIPQVEYGETTTLLAINLGGALIPTAVSLYLLWKSPSAIWYSLVCVIIVAVVTHVVARPVKGVGIATPPLISPIAAALSAIILPSGAPRVVAYVGGVLGTLIGADLTNLRVIPELGAPIASIGGAGTFDGVFLSGIIAVILAV